MLRPGQGALRALRAVGLVALVLGLSATAHSWAGASLPGFGPMLGLGLLLLPFAAVATGRRLAALPLLGLLTLGQLVGHAGLSLLGPGHAASAVACAPVGGHAHHLALTCTTTSPAGHTTTAGHGSVTAASAMSHGDAAVGIAHTDGIAHGLLPTGSMLAAHLVAALALALVIAHAERVFWRVVDLLTPALPQAPVLRPAPLLAPMLVLLTERTPRWTRTPSRAPPALAM
ncbi:hypothetical protein ACQP1U_12195 [Actinomycetota bacterium]